jgi:hypothetical protein
MEEHGSAALKLYRTIKNAEPDRADFFSDEAAGKLPPRNPDKVRYWRGFSAYNTLEQARATAQRNRRQGNFIAEMTIAVHGPITYEQWGRTPGHHTVWGDPDGCLASVTSVHPVFVPNEEREDGDVL